MIRKFLISTAFAAIGTAAVAADLPNTKGPVLFAAPPIFTWTGFYIGVNAGVAAFDHTDRIYNPVGFGGGNDTPPTANIFRSAQSNNAGFTGGGQIGYNVQFGSAVVGLETDIQGVARGNGNNIGVVLPGVAGITPYALVPNRSNNMNWFGTLRARIGYAFNRTLFFATGGLAYGGGNGSTSISYFNQTNGGLVPTGVYTTGSTTGNNKSRTGFALGGGVEQAINNNWSVKLEYLYVDLGKRNDIYRSPVVALAGTSFTSSNNNNRNHIIRAGLNYRF